MTNAVNVNVNPSVITSNNINNSSNIKTVQLFADAPKWLVPLSSSITGGLTSSSAMAYHVHSTNKIINNNKSDADLPIEQIQAID